MPNSQIFMADCKVTTDKYRNRRTWFNYILKKKASQKDRFNSTVHNSRTRYEGNEYICTSIKTDVHTRGQLRWLTSNAGHSYAVLWGNSRWEAEVECNMPVVMVDHVCEDGYAGDCESNSENLSDCRADGDAALTDHWKHNEIKCFKTLFYFLWFKF